MIRNEEDILPTGHQYGDDSSVHKEKVVRDQDQFDLYEEDPVLNIDELTNNYNEVEVGNLVGHSLSYWSGGAAQILSLLAIGTWLVVVFLLLSLHLSCYFASSQF